MNQEQLKEVECFAGLFMFTKAEILLIIGLENPTPEQHKLIDEATKVGQLKSKAKLYQSIFNLAYNGSSEAHKQVSKIIENSTRKKY